MSPLSIVVFREVLEMSIILGILSAVTRDLKGSFKWIAAGVIIGLKGSIALAFFMKSISNNFDGHGQELFNALILFTASIMIGWTVIWMQKHAKNISTELKEVSLLINEGRKPLYILAFITFFTIIREGAEIVLFSYSYFINGSSVVAIFSSLAIGSLLGILVGLFMYFGMLKAFGKYFFKISSYVLIFLSSAIMMKSVGYFVKSGILPTLGSPIFDSSAILPKNSFLGQILHVTLGYIDRPYGVQVSAYIAVFILLLYLFKTSNGKTLLKILNAKSN